MYEYKAKLKRVLDGDTIDCDIDMGFDIHKKVRVRLSGIDSPSCRTRDLTEKRYGLGANGILRRLARWCSLATGGIVLAQYINVRPLFIVASVVFSFGLICLFLLLANVADWVRDEKAKASIGGSMVFIEKKQMVWKGDEDESKLKKPKS